MKNWLKNILIAGGVLVGGVKGFAQNNPDSAEKYLQSNELKTYTLQKDEPKSYDNPVDTAKYIDYLENSEWKTYKVHEGEKPPIYNTKDSISENKPKLVDFKEAKKKLGIKSITELKNLGHGYITSKKEYNTFGGKNYHNLRLIEGINSGTVELNSNGKKEFHKGTLSGDISEKVLSSVDSVHDHIITEKEISNALNKEYQKAFFDYASETLGVSKKDVIKNGKYFTSRNLEKKLNILGDVFEKRFQKPREKLYEVISGEDAIITEGEILKSAEVLKKHL